MSGQQLNATYLAVISSPQFRTTVSGYTWGMLAWGPFVPGYTVLSDIGGQQNPWWVPVNWNATGVFFMFGAWNPGDGTAHGTIYAEYVISQGSVVVNLVPRGPNDCVIT